MLPYSKVNYNTYKHWPWVYPFHILQPKSNAESTTPHRGAYCTIRQHQIGRLFAGTCMQPLVPGVVHEVKKNPWAPHLGNSPSQDSSKTLSFPNLMMKLLGKKQLSCSQWILSWIEDVISKFPSNNAKSSWAKVDWLHSVVVRWIKTSNCTSWDVMLIASIESSTVLPTGFLSTWIFWWAWSNQSYPKNSSHVLKPPSIGTNDFVIQGHPSAPLCYFFFPVTPRGDRWSPHSSVLLTALATLKRVVCSRWANDDDDDDDGCLLFCIWELFVELIWR